MPNTRELTNSEVLDGFKDFLEAQEKDYKDNKYDKFDDDMLDYYAMEVIRRKLMKASNVIVFVGQATNTDLSNTDLVIRLKKQGK